MRSPKSGPQLHGAGVISRAVAALSMALCVLLLSGACTPQPSPVVSVPTMSPVIPESAIAEQLHTVLAKNFTKPGVADCVQKALLDARSQGKLALVDLDNYVRNVVTDPMKKVLVDLQNAGTCTDG